MKYHYYLIGRTLTGSVAFGQSLTVYDDESMSTEAVIYSDSAGLTEADNPIVVPATGVIEFWCDDSAVWGLASGDTVARPLYALPINTASGVINVRDYGLKGDGSTDDSTAFAEVVLTMIAESDNTGPGNEGITPPIYFPPGKYILSDTQINTKKVRIFGAGMYATELWISGATPLLSLGTYDSTPANAWQGDAPGLTLEYLTVRDPDYDTLASCGSRVATAIQDNGSGKVTLRDVGFAGLKYGVFAPYGHDFCNYFNVDSFKSDTLAYFGPGSQQIHIWGGASTLHDRAFIIEGAKDIHLDGFVFSDPKTRDIDLQCPAVLLSGVDTEHLTLNHEQLISIWNCWFETGSGWNTGWEPLEHIRVGDYAETSTIRQIDIRNVGLVSGTAGMADTTNHVLLNADKGKYIDIVGIQIRGSYIDAVATKHVGTSYPIWIDRKKTVDGYDDIPCFLTEMEGNKIGWDMDEDPTYGPPRLYVSEVGDEPPHHNTKDIWFQLDAE